MLCGLGLSVLYWRLFVSELNCGVKENYVNKYQSRELFLPNPTPGVTEREIILLTGVNMAWE